MKRLLGMLLVLGVVLGCGSKNGDTPAAPGKATKTAAAPDEATKTLAAAAEEKAAAVKKNMQPAQLALGDPVVNSIGIVLVPIPAGEFMMGDEDQAEASPHQVKISNPFHLGAFEVTQDQYEKVMGKNPSKFNGPEFKDAKDRPVEMVTWEDAVEFCRKLSALPEETAAGRAYRLPTEAEWEYACRAGVTTNVSSLGQFAWYDMNSEDQTHTVGERKPNPWGLHDMHGNVYEWCEDWHADYPSGSATDPTGPKSGSIRVSRGGSWLFPARVCQPGRRYGNNPGFQSSGSGFRVVQDPRSATKPASETESEN